MNKFNTTIESDKFFAILDAVLDEAVPTPPPNSFTVKQAYARHVERHPDSDKNTDHIRAQLNKMCKDGKLARTRIVRTVYYYPVEV